jgi:uncharacterized protein YqgV (UPF0045/DUF77 family)
MAGVRIEFTVEPFVEGHPGPHVLAAIEAVREQGLAVEVGPFSTTAEAPAERAGTTIARLVQAGLDHGATRISLHIERPAEDGG